MTKARTKGEKRRDKAHRPAPESSAQPSDPITGPSTYARQHAEYERREQHKGDRRPYVRVHNTRLDLLQSRGIISRQQAEAGVRFEADHEAVWGHPSAGTDSCVPRAGGKSHETGEQAERIIRAKERMHAILNKAGPAAYAAVRRVAVYDEKLGAVRDNAQEYLNLAAGLNAAAAVYGVPVYLTFPHRGC